MERGFIDLTITLVDPGAKKEDESREQNDD
jgi:hypothetical protein